MKNTSAKALALQLGNHIVRQMTAIESKRTFGAGTASGNPFAGVTRGKTDDARKLRNLTGALNDLGAANQRYMVVERAYQLACEELNTASAMACQIVGVDLESIAASLGETGDGATSATDAVAATLAE